LVLGDVIGSFAIASAVGAKRLREMLDPTNYVFALSTRLEL
jgi:hypothetical protein